MSKPDHDHFLPCPSQITRQNHPLMQRYTCSGGRLINKTRNILQSISATQHQPAPLNILTNIHYSKYQVFFPQGAEQLKKKECKMEIEVVTIYYTEHNII